MSDSSKFTEKIEWRRLPVYVALWLLYKSAFITPFLIGFYFFGKSWSALITGFTGTGIIFFALDFCDSRCASQDSAKS